MQKKIIVASIVVLVVVVILGFYIIYSGQLIYKPALLQVGETIDTNIQSSHPYPNGVGGKVLVWSETLEHQGATSLRLHFNKFEIKGIINTPTIFEEVDYGECDLNALEGYERILIDPNTIQENQIVEQQPGEVSVGSTRLIKCGIVQEKKQFTPQEIFDNYNEYIQGDFVAIKDKNGKVLDILLRESLPNLEGSPADFLRQDVWGQTYHDIDTITIELYADESDNGFGLYIDKYARGFTEEEIDEAN